MNARQFFDLTAEMREAQRKFLVNQNNDALMLKKITLEEKIDAEISRVKEIMEKVEPIIKKDNT